MEYARLLRDESMTSRAAAIIREVTNPTDIAEFLIDKRFDSLRGFEGMPVLSDMPAQLQTYLKDAELKSQQHPDLLDGALRYISALRTSGEFIKAQEVAASIAANMGESAENSPYKDYDDKASWLLNEWAYTLYDLGRNDEARAALRKAAGTVEFDDVNVSQLINLSSLLVSEGRFDEALSEISKLKEDKTSPYGMMWAKSVEVCASAFQDRLDGARATLTYMQAHGEDNVSALSKALVCADDIDAAAALYIKRLQDPAQSIAALKALQTTISAPAILPYDVILNERFDRMKARADVQDAIDDVGRVMSFPFYTTYWGDL